MNFIKAIPVFGLIYLWPVLTGEKAVFLSCLVLFMHIFLFRALGLYVNIMNLFPDFKADSKGDEDPTKFWEYVLEPFLDTENIEQQNSANSSLMKMGLKVWQIKALRFANGIGFGLSFTDEWLSYSYEDLVSHWQLTLLLDGLIAVLFLVVWREVGIVFGVLWILEALIFSGLIFLNKWFQHT